MSQPELISQFQSFTNTSTQVSQHYLESHNWDLHLAVASFFRDQDDDGQLPPQPQIPQPQIPQPQIPQPQASRPKTTKAQGSIRTLSDFSGNDNDDEDPKQTYYTGGEKSGQLVQTPGKPFKVDDIFESAKKYGAESVDQDKKNDNFSGSGFRLGSDMNVASQKTESRAPLNITFWKNGFQVGDSPLRAFTDPANKEFLEDIGKGIVPRELESNRRGLSVHLIQKNEDYVAPKYQAKPFSGAGQTLGSTTSTQSTATPTPAAAPPTNKKSMTLDPDRPVTTLQIRLHDGTKLQAKFNHHHTLQDVRNFIDSALVLPSGRAYQIMTPPRQIITNLNQTLEEAKLLNSVIIQSLL